MTLQKPIIRQIFINSIIHKKRIKSFPIQIISYPNRHNFALNQFTKKSFKNINPEPLKNLSNLPQNLKLICINILQHINQN
jgi:hypothetical protein